MYNTDTFTIFDTCTTLTYASTLVYVPRNHNSLFLHYIFMILFYQADVSSSFLPPMTINRGV